ncbi:phosphatase PAP2 family protein [Pontibacter actiniarum]|uniref:Phosphatase PAP2 family protein n=1 Tax=Pontibacter actiniarum TaxID=323450 RepID=A0A1X9YV48_9BACT|nr:phosphatase PAP2 family protein [Pontibacter actiniarum]ARS36712.1 phosphatase PAP2 family protein [Pontibacter actiniarum]
MKNVLIDKVRNATGRVLGQPPVQRFRKQHPKLSAFVAGRFDTSSFIGLPLTLIVLAAGGNIALLSQLTESVLEAEWVVRMDKEFTAMLYNVRTEWLSKVLLLFTRLCDREGVFIIGGVVTLVLLLQKHWLAICAFWFTLGGVGLSVQFGKDFVSRARPADVAYYTVAHFSFPSGHSTTAIAMFGLLAYLLYLHYQERWQRRLVVWVAIILILTIGFSRIYLGVHYLSDVLAGFLLGALWLLVGISVIEVMRYRRRRYADLHQR